MTLTPGQLTSPQAARVFLLGGHATLTLVSKKTGTRFTYRVSKAPENRAKSQGEAYFVSVLNGPENTADYAYIGLLCFDHGPQEAPRFFRTQKSRVASDSAPSFAAFRWAVERVFSWAEQYLEKLPADLEIWHQGRCGVCGRALTVPESIASGVGPTCASRGA